MEKLTEEEDLKILEEEIDNAVDRLFVAMKRDPEESFLMESPLVEPPLKPSALEPSPPELSASEPSTEPSVFESPIEPHPSEPLEPSIQSPILEPSVRSSLLEPSYEFEKSLDVERPLHPTLASSPAPVPIPFLKSIERMEAQLLSLEWEITREKLEKAREEVLALKELLKQKAEMTSILSSMENVLDHMTKNEGGIRPPWTKFLLDSKETIKLLMRKETGGEINIYKQLASLGIEARFSCLEGMKDNPISQLSSEEGEVQAPGLSIAGEKKIGEMSKSVHLFMRRMEEIFGTIQQQIVKLEETSRKLPAPSVEARSPAINVTVFKIDERLFGVESEKVFKLFKVPKTSEEKVSDQQKIRLRDVEVRMVDLKKRLAIQGEGPKEQIRILTVKEDGTYKGFMVDEVLKRVSILSERRGEAGGYFSGVFPLTYQEQAVNVPILDLNKF
jgi:chemotaxis signal transduction protein